MILIFSVKDISGLVYNHMFKISLLFFLWVTVAMDTANTTLSLDGHIFLLTQHAASQQHRGECEILRGECHFQYVCTGQAASR